MPAVPQPPDISPEQITADLAGLLRSGATVAACRKGEVLTKLTIVHAKAATDRPDDLAAAASHLIAEACARVDDIKDGDTAILLGLATGWRGRLVKERRHELARRRAVSPEQIRQGHEPHMLAAVADEIYAMDAAHRLRHRHRTEIEENPTKSTLKVDWLEQHRQYGRIYTPVVALRADLLVLAVWLQELRKEDQPDDATHHVLNDLKVDADWWLHVNERLAQMTWRMAQFHAALVRFVDEHGGLWLLSDPESEVQATDALYRLGLFLPFGDANFAWTRRLLAEVEHSELDVFMAALFDREDRWAAYRTAWLGWVEELLDTDPSMIADLTEEDVTGTSSPTLAQDPTDSAASRAEPEPIRPRAAYKPSSRCGQWIAASEALIQLMEADWWRVADWYRASALAD